MNLSEWLSAQGAQNDVVQWAAPFDGDTAALWAACPRGDWLLGIAARVGAPRRALVTAARACIDLALDHAPDDEVRVVAAVEALDQWLAGHDDPIARERTCVAVELAADEAPDPAAQAAALAVRAAIGAIDSPDEAAATVSFIVQAAMLDVGDCAVMSAMRYAQATCADRVREHLPYSDVAERLEVS